MANQLANNPWKLDTVSATPVKTGTLKLMQMVYTNYTVESNKFQLQDQLGNVIWEGDGNADFSPVASFRIGWVEGLALTVLEDPAAIILVFFE